MSYEFLPQDDFLFHLDSINAPELVKFFQRRHLLAGVLLIILGVYILLHNFVLPIFYFTFQIDLYPLFESLPTLVVAAAIILLGVHLIRSTVSHKAILSPGKPISLTDERLCNREGFPVTQSPPPFLFPKGRCYHVKSE